MSNNFLIANSTQEHFFEDESSIKEIIVFINDIDFRKNTIKSIDFFI